MNRPKKTEYDWDTNPAIEDLPEGSFEYVLTQEMVDQYREAVDDPEARYPTIAGKHDTKPMKNVYLDGPRSINSRTMVECFNPPVPGKKLLVTGGVNGRYVWRGRRYFVTEATCRDEDGRLIERQSSTHMFTPEEVGRKWQ